MLDVLFSFYEKKNSSKKESLNPIIFNYILLIHISNINF